MSNNGHNIQPVCAEGERPVHTNEEETEEEECHRILARIANLPPSVPHDVADFAFKFQTSSSRSLLSHEPQFGGVVWQGVNKPSHQVQLSD